MRAGRPMLLRWGAIVALALLALAAAHSHDAADGRGDTCVPCHVHGSPLIAPSVHGDPDPATGGSLHARAQACARDAEIEGCGSRAPPA